MRPYIYILILLVISFSCVSKLNDHKGTFQLLVTDTLKHQVNFNEFELSKQNAALLRLPNIFNGVDSFEMRIWVTGSIQPFKVVLLKFEKDWRLSAGNIYVDGDKLDSINSEKVKMPPNIEKLVSLMLSDSILQLPSQQAIPNFVDRIADGQFCFIEIATRRLYKALFYHCPEHYLPEPNHMRFCSLIKDLSSDLNYMFYTPWCSPNH